MGALLALVFIVALSMLVVRIGANALVLTGMSEEASRFQASSAFFGVGFTTNEAELIMSNIARRKIVLYLIVAGNIGLTSALATIVITIIQTSGNNDIHPALKIGFLALCIISTALFFNLKIIRRPLDALMKIVLKRMGINKFLDYSLLLNVQGGYCISDLTLFEEHIMQGKSLAESTPSAHGILVLSVHSEDGSFLGAPDKDTVVKTGDTLMLYGKSEDVESYAKLSHIIE